MIIAAYLGVSGLTDVGYRLYDASESALAARVTSGITDAGVGWYSASATLGSAASVRWDSIGTASAIAREYFDPSVPQTGDSYPLSVAIAGYVDTEVAAILASLATYVSTNTLAAIAAANRDVDNTAPSANSLGAEVNRRRNNLAVG